MDRDIVFECRELSHWFGGNRVLHDVGFRIVRGEIVALVGPSGCGKSTLLRAVVGTHPPCRGLIVVRPRGALGERPVSAPGRDRGIVYQRYSLFPFLTARENVALGPMLDETGLAFRALRPFRWRRLRRRHLERSEELLTRFGLGGALGLYPHEMSGGMCQRVAIAQALIMKPEILLLDEPFGALDEATREELQRTLLTLYGENCRAAERGAEPPLTILIVTHEINEAVFVADRVLGLSQYWNWRECGHAECPGATIVYDAAVPVFAPDAPRNFEFFRERRREILETVFDPGGQRPRDRGCVFWRQIEMGEGEGVLRPWANAATSSGAERAG